MIRRTVKAVYFGESFLHFSCQIFFDYKTKDASKSVLFLFSCVDAHYRSFERLCPPPRPAPPPRASPLAGRVVDLIALAAADGDGVEGLEGAQAHPGDGHVAGGEHDQDGLGVIEGHRQVVAHGDHQRVGAAAEAPLTCGERCFLGGGEGGTEP